MEAMSPSKWAPDEIRRFYRGFCKYGSDFYKVSKMVGGGKAPEMCASLWRRHQAYLSLAKEYQSEVAFVALVQDGGASRDPYLTEDPIHRDSTGGGGGGGSGIFALGRESHAHHLGDDDDDLTDAELAASMPLARYKDEGDDDDDDDDDDENAAAMDAAAAVVSISSPEKVNVLDASLAATRPRRTPKRSNVRSPGGRGGGTAAGGGGGGGGDGNGPAPTTAKRTRSGRGEEDIYEYYDEGGIAESARKRRAARQKLNFEGESARRGGVTLRGEAITATTATTATATGTGGGVRRSGGDVERGIDALMALAGRKNGGGAGGGNGDNSGGAGGEVFQRERSRTPFIDDVEEEEEEEDALGVMMDDERDEDYRAGGRERRGKRTPHSTPHKIWARPPSEQNTPARMGGRGGLASPGGSASVGGGSVGLRSPPWGLESLGGDFLGCDYPGSEEMPYLASPGMPVQLPANFIPSPKNPMPRLRRRKQLSEHATPRVISPIKSVINRHKGGGGGGGGAGLAVVNITSSNYPGRVPPEPIPENASEAEVCIRHALTARLRKFSMFEFFYSAIDRAWYFDNTVAELLHHMGLAPGTKLTRKEWTTLRSGLGRPRRLSWAFLRESRARLEHHRRTARTFYSQEYMDPTLAATLPRQIAVGQAVIARHPVTWQLHDGTILTTAADNYRVQFNRQDLGVEVVSDIDVMPSEPWENLPTAALATRPRLVIAGRLVLNGRPVPLAALPSARLLSGGSSAHHPHHHQQQHQQQMASALAARAQGPLPDPSVMADVATFLDRKEALLVQLRQMNDEAASGVHNDAATGKPNEIFSKSYASVAMKLSEVNEQLKEKLMELENSANGGGNAAATINNQNTGDGMSLPLELLEEPITAGTLSSAAIKEAKRFVLAGRERVVLQEDQKQSLLSLEGGEDGGLGTGAFAAGGVKVGDAHLPTGAVAPLIEGAAWTLSLLQLGADRLVPAAALTTALDGSILSVKPSSVGNAALYTEIEATINSLKMQLLAAS